MIYFLKHFKGIAYLLAMLILFQSCIAYKKTPSTIEEASSEKNTHIKIITKEGKEHELRWIEEKEGNAVTIINTKRIFVKKDKIKGYVINNPGLIITSLETAIDFEGIVYIATNDYYNPDIITHFKYAFINVEDQGEYIRGIKMTGKDTATVIIPIEQIEEIKLMNKDLSIGVPILLSTFIIVGGLFWYVIANIKIQVFP